jgi:hypothetical protein
LHRFKSTLVFDKVALLDNLLFLSFILFKKALSLCYSILVKIDVVLHFGMALDLVELMLNSIQLQKHCLDLYVIVFSEINNFIFEFINLTILPFLPFNKYY